MKIKKDDNVIVITGKDKGKTGKVLRAFPQDFMVLVEGINIKKSHEKSRQEGKKGQIIERSHPIHVSNVRKSEGTAAPKKTAKKPASKKE
jgi:large subunit ribosomal protein L24